MPQWEPPEAPEKERQAVDVPAGTAEWGRDAVQWLLPTTVLLLAD